MTQPTHPLAGYSLDDHELAVQHAFYRTAPDIFLRNSAKRYNLIATLLTLTTDATPSQKVASALLTAQARSLRTVQLMAARGYSQEAAALTRIALERGFLQAFISNDASRAQKWINHNDETTSVENFFNCVKAVAKRWYRDDRDERNQFLAAENKLYAQVSGYAHNNPAITKLLDLRQIDGNILLSTMPSPTVDNFIQCSRIFLAAQRATEISLHAFCEAFTEEEQQKELFAQITALGQERISHGEHLELYEQPGAQRQLLKETLEQHHAARLNEFTPQPQQPTV